MDGSAAGIAAAGDSAAVLLLLVIRLLVLLLLVIRLLVLLLPRVMSRRHRLRYALLHRSALWHRAPHTIPLAHPIHPTHSTRPARRL